MPRRKRSSSPCDLFDDDFDDDSNSQSSRNGHPPIQRNAANARERARMRVLSSAFGRLKTKLPNIPPDTKLSKLDTLRLATMYIKQLRALAEGSNSTNNDAINPIQFNEHSSLFGMQNGAHNLTWPFGLHHIQHATNRQMPFHCSTMMEWSPQHEPVKDTRLAAEETTYYTQNQNHAPQLHAWYTTENTNLSTQSSCHNNHFDMFNGFNQEAPHGQSQHTTSSHHQQNTMSPIR